MAIQPQATRSLRRVKVRTPGGNLVIHYTKRKPKVAKCGNCKKELKGIPRERPSVFRNLSLSKKRVERPYGGNLCSQCTRETIISKFKDLKKLPFEIGQVCVKIAGKEGGKICAIADKINENFVLIDGQVKRRRCNIFHVETLDKKIDIKQNESSDVIKKELKKLGYEILEKKKTNKKTLEKVPSELSLEKKEPFLEKASGKMTKKTSEKKTEEKDSLKKEKQTVKKKIKKTTEKIKKTKTKK